MVQVYADKTVTTLGSNAIVASVLPEVLLNMTIDFKMFLIDRSYTLIAFLPAFSTLKGADEDDSESMGRSHHGFCLNRTGVLVM